jgi:hypothetical protein
MNRIVSTIGAASILVLSGVAYGAQPMTAEQMDSVTAGGIASGTTSAVAVGPSTYVETIVSSLSQSLGPVSPDPQFGSFEIIQSTVAVGATSVSGGTPPFGGPAGVAVGIASSAGATVGDLLSDTVSSVSTSTNSFAPAVAAASAQNKSIAASYTIPSSASSASVGLATLTK